MLGIEDESILAEFEEEEKSNPSPRKLVGNRVIYASRELKRTDSFGRPVLCDFGQARFGSARYGGDIQPYIYRAPEILLRTTWDEKVDIWNLAVLVSRPLIHFSTTQLTHPDMEYFSTKATILCQRFKQRRLECLSYG